MKYTVCILPHSSLVTCEKLNVSINNHDHSGKGIAIYGMTQKEPWKVL